ncbi:MAG: hypothetical protein H6983_03345 [Ectothiorhodospiraceae bacterium]|nr:hypothetical protein [Ectothiorhodospiraceae bacterium]
MVTRRARGAAWLLAVLVTVLVTPAPADDRITPFLGEFAGTAVVPGGEELSPRDTRVRISAGEKGFRVAWTVLIHRGDGETRRRDFEAEFRPSPREGIYRSAMRRNLFGQAVPFDPLAGDPYVWARIEGDTLSVFALLITETGGYEMQVYDRTLVPEGLRLRYSRVRDGEILRTATGLLRRIG